MKGVQLLIVESPNKCKKLKSILGDGWVVKASAGHIRDLPIKEIGVEAPKYKPNYVASDRSKSTIADLKRWAQKASVVYLATDLDREGEAIAWHLKDVLKLRNYHRVTFQEITERAVKAAIERTRDIDMDLVHAQEARRVIDRLVGYRISSIASKLTRLPKMSAGRVQSPCLKIVVEREKEIKDFKPKNHYALEVGFVEDGAQWSAKWMHEHLMKDEEDTYWTDIHGIEGFRDAIEQENRFKVLDISKTQSRRKAPSPFTTASLQQCASTVLGMDPDETMKIAQSLFEQGLITYHRTDAVFLSDEAVMATRNIIRDMEDELGDGYLPRQAPVFDSGENAQEAHESIRPTDISIETIKELSQREQTLYSLIRNRTIACQMAPCIIESNKIKMVSGAKYNGQQQPFEAKGLRTLFNGWRVLGDEIGKDVGGDTEEGENDLPEIEKGSIKRSVECLIDSKKTKAPPRYTQASLIKKMEKEGIGRPSTYANILKNIMDRAYIEQKARKLKATDRGISLIEALDKRFMFMDIEYTMKMEKVLDNIAHGKRTYFDMVKFMDERLTDEIQDLGIKLPSNEKRDENCPKCKKAMYKREGKNGDFWGCSGFPKCKETAPVENIEEESV